MLPKFSVKKPFTVFVAVIMIIVLGFVSFSSMSTDLLPKMNMPYAIIMTTYVGASPEKVETTVTKPIEQAVATVNNVENVSSVSSENSSMVMIEFSQAVNMDSAIIDLNNKLDLIKSSFDDQVGSPMIMQVSPDMMPVMVASIDVDGKSIEEISNLVNKKIMPALEKTNGVASVSATGLVEENIKIVLNQDKIDAINNKVLANIDSQLASTQSNLNKAKSQITQGQNTLKQQSQEQTAKLVDGLKAIENGKEQLNTAEKELNSKATQLDASKTILTEATNKLIEQETQIQEQIKSLSQEENPTPAQSAILERLNSSLQTLQQKKLDANSKLAELEAGLTQINNGKEELASKKAQIEEQEKQLEIAKVTLSTELSTASSKLASSQAELEKGQKEFESARDEAYKNASLEGVITQSMISNILTAENFSMPAGSIKTGNDKLTVKVGEKFSSIDEIKNLTLFAFDMEGLENVTLEQLADIDFSNNSDELYAKVNGNDGVVVAFQKQSTASTSTVSKDIKKSIENIEKENPDVHFTALMDQGIYIDLVINSVLENLISGGILAIIILFLFLRDIRPTLVISLSIPISLMGAIVLMYFSGVTINIISLSGLALGVGMLVDNSIVVIENIYRLRNKGMSAKKAAMEGASSVAGAILASTLTTVCVFLPIVFVQGISRQLFTDMGLTIAYSLLASLIIALTLVPAMSSSVFKNTKEKKHKFFDAFSNAYEKLLRLALKFKPLVLIFAIVMLVLSGVWATKMGTEFIPSAEGTQMSLSIEMPKESTFEDLKNTSNTIIDRLLTIDNIKTIGAMESSSMGMISSTGSQSKNVSMYAILKEDKSLSNNEIKEKILDLTKDLNCEISVRTSNMDMSALTGSGVQVVIKGNDIATLQKISGDIANLMTETEGFIDIDDGVADISKELKVTVDKNKAMKYGLTVASVYQSVATAIKQETTSTNLSVESKDYPVVVVQSEKNTITEDNLYSLELDGKENQEEVKVKLSDIASIEKVDSLASISHDNNQRYITVSASVDTSHNIGLVSRDFEQKLKDYQLPDGYTAEIAGESENINSAMFDLVKMIGLALLFIYLIMVAQFQSLLAPFIIMFTIPLAFTGGLLALGITGTELSIIAMLGFLVLSGIVVNNGIVFIDYINQLRAGGMEKTEAIVLAGKTRLRPILMTALTTILGLSTLALGMGSGAEMLQPLGIVTIGGLIYSTLLTLLVVPCMYDIMHKKQIKNRDIEE